MNRKRPIFVLFELLSRMPRKYKYKSIFSLLIMILNSFAELISLSLILPFLLILTSPKDIVNYKIIIFFSSFFKIDDPSQLILIISILFILSCLLTALIRIFNLYFVTQLAASIGNHFAYESFRRMLYQDYMVHINTNTSELIANITLNVSRTVLIINQLFLLFTSIFIGTGIIIGLLIVNYKITISSLFVFSAAYVFIALLTKKKLSKNSKIITESSELQIRSLQEGLGSIRDIMINSSYGYFLKIFNKSDKSLRLSLAENQVIAGFPRYAIESLGIILIVILSLNFKGNSESLNVIPLLGTLAFASQKLIPLIQQIYTSFSNIRAYSSSLFNVMDLVYKKINSKNYECLNKSKIFTKDIELKNVNFRYVNEKPLILKNVNLKIYKGQSVGIIGQTGSGKSTLIDILMGLLEPSSGEFFIDNKQLYKENSISNLRSIVSHVPQSVFLSDGTFLENIAFGIEKSKIDYERVINVSKKACLLEVIESSANGFETKVGERGMKLSGGQRQRIGIARALYRKSEILFLDEATSALDINTERKLINNINSLGYEITIIIIAHRLSTLKLCDNIFEVKDGNVVKNNYSQIKIK